MPAAEGVESMRVKFTKMEAIFLSLSFNLQSIDPEQWELALPRHYKLLFSSLWSSSPTTSPFFSRSKNITYDKV